MLWLLNKVEQRYLICGFSKVLLWEGKKGRVPKCLSYCRFRFFFVASKWEALRRPWSNKQLQPVDQYPYELVKSSFELPLFVAEDIPQRLPNPSTRKPLTCFWLYWCFLNRCNQTETKVNFHSFFWKMKTFILQETGKKKQNTSDKASHSEMVFAFFSTFVSPKGPKLFFEQKTKPFLFCHLVFIQSCGTRQNWVSVSRKKQTLLKLKSWFNY